MKNALLTVKCRQGASQYRGPKMYGPSLSYQYFLQQWKLMTLTSLLRTCRKSSREQGPRGQERSVKIFPRKVPEVIIPVSPL